MAEPRHAKTAGARLRQSHRFGEPPDASWWTAITRIQPNAVVVRGYPVDELLGRLSFAEAVYLIVRGEAPTRAIGRLCSAILGSSRDHGVTPPSTLAVRHVATSGAPFASCLAAGILRCARSTRTIVSATAPRFDDFPKRVGDPCGGLATGGPTRAPQGNPRLSRLVRLRMEQSQGRWLASTAKPSLGATRGCIAEPAGFRLH